METGENDVGGTSFQPQDSVVLLGVDYESSCSSGPSTSPAIMILQHHDAPLTFASNCDDNDDTTHPPVQSCKDDDDENNFRRNFRVTATT